MSAIEEKLEVVKKRIAAAKARSPYRQDVTLVAVTKFHPLEDMEEVLRLGVKEVGENRVQELEDKTEPFENACCLEPAGTSSKK